MKQKITFCITLTFLFFIGSIHLEAQDTEETGLPGDHFSLEATIEIFKNSNSLEDFEKKLNSEDSQVNNLDLNEDGKIDYILVNAHKEGDMHAIVLSVPLSQNETQDIAVIEIEKNGKESALLQIIGDEDIYGENVIVEPFEEESNTGNKGGPYDSYTPIRVTVNVFGWAPVRYMYRPTYVVYASPYRYSYYPRWWRPWRPLSFHVWHPIRIRHRTRYHVVSTHRVVRAHKIYTPKRRTTTVVASRTKVAKSRTVVKTNSGKAVVTKTNKKGVVKGGNGNKVAASKSTTTVKAKTANGKTVKTSKTTTKAKANTKKTKVAGKKTTKKATVKGKKGKASVKKTKTTKVKKKKKN